MRINPLKGCVRHTHSGDVNQGVFRNRKRMLFLPNMATSQFMWRRPERKCYIYISNLYVLSEPFVTKALAGLNSHTNPPELNAPQLRTEGKSTY